MLLQLKTGAYAAIIPFAKPTPASSAATGSIVFKAGPSNRMYVHPESSDLSSIRAAASVNQYPHDAMLEAFGRIQQLLSLPLSAPSVSTASPIADSEYQLAEHLGYCTWNTFYQNVTHAGLVNVLADIFEAGRSSSQPLPGWVLIDDGWQTVSECGGHGQLRDICANAERFPGQLRGTVTALQNLGVGRVGVWHALWGYWGGVDPDSLLGQRYALERFRRRSTSAVSGDADVWLVAASHVSRFYDEFYGWLRDQGISFVKVDYQAAFETLDNIYSSTGVSEMCHAYYTAMESSALKHFGAGSVIYCMSHSPQLILHALQQHQSTPGSSQPPVRMTFRNTDDYFPDVYDSHGWHIYCNMANTIWSRALAPNFIIDWDMFRPGGDVGRLHAVSRILSGGLFCITGHKPDYVGGNLASYVGPSGRVSLREPPLISSQCLFTDMTQSPGLLVGSTVVPESESVVIAAYNVSSGPVVAPLFVSRVCAEAMGFHARRSIGSTPGRHISDRTAGSSSVPTELPSNGLYVVHQHSTGQIRVTNVAGRVYAVALRSLTADIFTVTRMAAFRSPDRTAVLYAACIGDTSRCVGVDVVERNVYSAILPPSPNSPRGSGASKTSCSHLRCWNIRARVSLHSRHVVFVVSAREVVLQPRMLPANIDAVHISGDTIASDDWAFESETGVLRITLPTSRRADALATACCTISLSA
ncbi:glycoside hydrolase [Martensiomyces pterosporus]|nr:glycoside hydrolase [Martensiomyces pterosporus]